MCVCVCVCVSCVHTYIANMVTGAIAKEAVVGLPIFGYMWVNWNVKL